MKEDLIGRRFGRLVVIEAVESGNSHGQKFLCKCDCGGSTISFQSNLKRGHSGSCGCLQRELMSNAKRTHGASVGRVLTAEYKCWRSIKMRCYNENSKSYKDYGGRGILMSESWLGSYSNFIMDMGLRPSAKHSIERRDNDEGYNVENCVWATRKEQSRNKRNSVKIEYNGKIYNSKEFSEICKFHEKTIRRKVRKVGVAGFLEYIKHSKPRQKKING